MTNEQKVVEAAKWLRGSIKERFARMRQRAKSGNLTDQDLSVIGKITGHVLTKLAKRQRDGAGNR